MAAAAPDMIEGKVAEPASAFAARLAERAARLAEARTSARGERRWRRAALLWPLFAKD